MCLASLLQFTRRVVVPAATARSRAPLWARPHASRSALGRSPAWAMRRGHVQSGGPRILVIDDERGERAQLARMIEGEGWSFYGAESVEEALAAVRDIEPEVIILEPGTEA